MPLAKPTSRMYNGTKAAAALHEGPTKRWEPPRQPTPAEQGTAIAQSVTKQEFWPRDRKSRFVKPL